MCIFHLVSLTQIVTLASREKIKVFRGCFWEGGGRNKIQWESNVGGNLFCTHEGTRKHALPLYRPIVCKPNILIRFSLLVLGKNIPVAAGGMDNTSTGYSSNALSSVGVGKTTIDPHPHLRQPGKEIFHCLTIFPRSFLFWCTGKETSKKH